MDVLTRCGRMVMSGEDSRTVLCYYIDQSLSAGTNFSLVVLSHWSINIVTLGSSQIVSGIDCVWAQILCLVDKICYPIIIQLATICRFCPSTLAESVWFHRIGLKLCYAASCMSVFH